MKEKKKLNGIVIITVLFLTFTLIIGLLLTRYYAKISQKSSQTNKYDKYYVMIVEDVKSDFWKSVYKSAYENGINQGVYVELMGENLTKEYSKEDLMRIAIASDVDGIIVVADESETMTALIDEAAAKDIMVVTLQGDNTNSRRLSFIGVGSYNLGREYGKQIVNIIENKAGVSNVAVLVDLNAKDSSQNILCSAISETIIKSGKNNINLSIVSVDSSNSFSAEESIRDIFMTDNQPDIIVCLSESNTTCVYQAVVDYNKVGQIDILGYYISDTILNGIDRNVIYATFAIDTDQLGQYCVDALREYSELGNTSQYFAADIKLVNKENVAEFLGGEVDEK